MMYTQFEDDMLLALYSEHIHFDENDFVSFKHVADKYGLKAKPGWLLESQKSLLRSGLVTGPSNASNDEMAIGKISAHGMRKVEEEWGTHDGVVLPLKPVGDDANVLQEIIEAPAAGRIVSFDHNAPQFLEIRLGLATTREAVRQANDISEAERDRLLRGLESAQTLWDSVQLKLIQIKVGVLMTVEDAAAALKSTVKATVISLLVDTIKAFIKTRTGIDLDHI